MKTLKKILIIPQYSERIPETETMLEGIIYISEVYETASHLCLCGCKNLTVTPLGTGQWTLLNKDDKLTITPSIGNYNFPCKSHYIITNGIANFV